VSSAILGLHGDGDIHQELDPGSVHIPVLVGILARCQNFTSPHAPISRVWTSVVVSLRRRSSLYAIATFTPLVTGKATPAFQ